MSVRECVIRGKASVLEDVLHFASPPRSTEKGWPKSLFLQTHPYFSSLSRAADPYQPFLDSREAAFYPLGLFFICSFLSFWELRAQLPLEALTPVMATTLMAPLTVEWHVNLWEGLPTANPDCQASQTPLKSLSSLIALFRAHLWRAYFPPSKVLNIEDSMMPSRMWHLTAWNV